MLPVGQVAASSSRLMRHLAEAMTSFGIRGPVVPVRYFPRPALNGQAATVNRRGGVSSKPSAGCTDQVHRGLGTCFALMRAVRAPGDQRARGRDLDAVSHDVDLTIRRQIGFDAPVKPPVLPSALDRLGHMPLQFLLACRPGRRAAKRTVLSVRHAREPNHSMYYSFSRRVEIFDDAELHEAKVEELGGRTSSCKERKPRKRHA